MLLTAATIGLLACLSGLATATPGVQSFSTSAAGLSVRAVRVDLDAARVQLALAWDHVGRTQRLGQIALRAHAVAAINGGFFDAYSSLPIKNPCHTLIAGGEVVHKGDVGTLLAFDEQGRPRMGRVACKIVGALDGSYDWPNNWYAYWINRYPEGASTITIFDRWFGERAPSGHGFYAVVKGGVVTWTGYTAPQIPQTQGDYVVYFAGSEQALGIERFRVGRQCAYRVDMGGGPVDETGGHFGDGLGCGPRLLMNGRVNLSPVDEGFCSPKILCDSCNRSAVGYSRDRKTLIMFTTGSGTIRGLAEAARALGLYDAMNLDGGASSGLWCDGRYLVTPGREISNALVVLKGKAD